MAFSRTTPGALWLHNDSGDAAVVYAVDASGTLMARVTLLDVVALDWEDMAIGPGPRANTPYLYVADIGDNLSFRPTVVVHRFPEPSPIDGDAGVASERIFLTYPDGPRDAEAMFVDPQSSQIVIITKQGGGIYVAPTGAFGDAVDLSAAGSLQIAGPVTAASADATGSRIVVRTPDRVLLWWRSPSQTVADALAAQPCELPSGSANRSLCTPTVAATPPSQRASNAQIFVATGD